MSQKTLIISILAFLIIGGIAAIFYAQNQTKDLEAAREAEQQAAEQATEQAPKMMGENVTFTITEGAKKRWELRVQKVFYYNDQTASDLEGVDGDLYSDEGKIVAKFTAPKGTFFNKKKQSLKLTGGVVVRSVDEEGSELQAPEMLWASNDKNVLAEGGVHLIKKGFGDSTAQRCQFSMDFSFISLQGQAQSQLDL